jgi:hypothetical protein
VGTAASAAIGGIGSELGGGKFENGAITGAFSYLFNQENHVVSTVLSGFGFPPNSEGSALQGIAAQQQADTTISQAEEQTNRISIYGAVGVEETAGNGAGVQGGVFLTVTPLNVGFFQTISPLQQGINVGLWSWSVGVVLGDFNTIAGPGYSFNMTSPIGGVSASYSNGSFVGYSIGPPSSRIGFSGGPTYTCVESYQGKGC